VRSMLRIRNAFGSTVLPVLLRRVEEASESEESARSHGLGRIGTARRRCAAHDCP